MVKLLFVLCAMHGTACRTVDPLYLPMPFFTCNTRQIAFFEQWAIENPELLARQRLEPTICVPLHAIELGL